MHQKYQNKYRISPARLQTWDYGSNAAYFITICTQNRQHSFGEIMDGKMEFSTIGLIVEHEWTKTPALRPDMNLELGEFTVMPNHFHAILIIGNNKYNTVGDDIDGDDGGHHRHPHAPHRRRRDAMHGVSTTPIPTTPTTPITTTPTTPTTPTPPPTPPTTTTTPNVTTETTHPKGPTDTNATNPTIVKPTTINNTGAGKNANQFGPQSKNLASIVRGFKSAVTTSSRKNGMIDFAWQHRFHDHIIRDAASFERIQNYIANNPSNWKEDKFNGQ